MFFKNLLDKNTKTFDIVEGRNKTGYWRQHNVRISLKSSLKIENRTLYQLSDPVIMPKCFARMNIVPSVSSCKRVSKNLDDFDWPCKPRPRPYAFNDSAHDLPGFSANPRFSDLPIIDWSAKGPIAASFDEDLVMWTPNTSKTIVYKIKDIKAVAFNPTGETLATGYNRYGIPIVEFWDISRNNILQSTGRFIFIPNNRDIRCLEWHPSGDSVACGTSTGEIFICCSSTFKRIKKLHATNKAIRSIKFSPKKKYLAATDVGGNIFIWCWNTFELHTHYPSTKSVKTLIAWHPWNGEDLIIAEQMPAGIIIANVPSKEIVGYYQRKDKICSIYAISFNKISAELIVSYTIRTPDGCTSSETMVMGSLDRIVDILKTHDENVRFLLWSPDSTQLATVGDDDTLTIWNFFAMHHKRFATTNVNRNNRKTKHSIFELYSSLK